MDSPVLSVSLLRLFVLVSCCICGFAYLHCTSLSVSLTHFHLLRSFFPPYYRCLHTCLYNNHTLLLMYIDGVLIIIICVLPAVNIRTAVLVTRNTTGLKGKKEKMASSEKCREGKCS